MLLHLEELQQAKSEKLLHFRKLQQLTHESHQADKEKRLGN